MKARSKHIPEPFGRPAGRSAKPEPVAHACEWPGCTADAEHKAPRDRTLRDYMWLCLDHVRDYNKSWNYYQGMSDREVEDEIRRDTCWQRPSWKLGTLGARPAWKDPRVKDPFKVFNEEGFDGRHNARRDAPARRPEPAEERALRTMDMDLPFTKDELKARYKALVKIHHPDVNRGEKAAEERLKDINEAYKTLLNALNA
ncbi:MAG: DnaJ domain-containing protein [Rhodospirillaceae bacterium]